ncbi:MAG TPA: glutathione peroxidase [Rhizobacter sp.]|nr:glutathione peroxidase [Rhizobacter sp.]
MPKPFFCLLLALSAAAGQAGAADCPVLLKREIPRLQDEKPQNLCQYAGKVVLVVNTASFCGFTPQYTALESLYSRYRERGLVVLGFPSNDFSQEPGDAKAIADFCENTYGVKFPMFMKTRVADSAGAEKSPFFADLKQATGEAPKWNFHKYVIARDGKTVQSFGTMTSPDSASFVQNIEKLLDSK